jgi:hypothetical protein
LYNRALCAVLTRSAMLKPENSEGAVFPEVWSCIVIAHAVVA